MSRYIDAEWLKEKIGNTAFLKLDDTEVVEQFIDTAPSIDIVRCKECKHIEEYMCRGIDDDFFCADGEREDE